MSQATGIVSIWLDGDLLDTIGGGEYEPGGFIRTRKESDHNVHYTEKREAGTVTCKVVHTSDTKLKKLQRFNGELKYETDSGKQYVIANAFCEGRPKVSGGEVDLVFVGDPGDE